MPSRKTLPPTLPKANGRPPYEPSKEDRRLVAIVAGGGMRHEDIALALGISRPTLRKYFQAELSVGAQLCRAQVLAAQYEAATAGRASAAKLYLDHAPEMEAPPVPGGEVQPATPAAPMGKKEQAQADAVDAARGTEWDALLPGGGRLQ